MLNVIIIDDEEAGVKALERLLNKHCSEVNVIAIAYSSEEAEEKINALKPDVVFLDIQMPYSSGFDLLSNLKNISFQVIFTTAYSQYAVKAFKYNAIDYLLKPIDPKELISAVKKCEERKNNGPMDMKKIKNLFHSISKSSLVLKVPIHTQDGVIFYDNDKVVRLEADGNYTSIYMVGGQKLTSAKTLKEYEEMLASKEFVRIHKAHLVNMNHINKYIKGEGGDVLMSDGSLLEVSRYKKNEFLDVFMK